MSNKYVNYRSLLGQQGINLIERIVLEMGYLWYPTGPLEAGIDGLIEIRNRDSGAVTNLILQVQSKATSQPFQAETEDRFEYVCEERDLDYWLQGNAPVILIVSRPAASEAYWISIKGYFADPATRTTRKVLFNKTRDRFSPSSAHGLLSIAAPRDRGVYFAPPPKKELLISNLLAVSSYAPRLSVAETEFRRRSEVWTKLKSVGGPFGSEWILRNKRILSFHKLDELPWREVCEPGTVEGFDTEEWALSETSDRANDFVDLLHFSLRELLWPMGVRYDPRLEHFYYQATRDLKPRKVPYQTASRKGKRTVFKSYASKITPDATAYYRHSAFESKFVRQGSQWFLEITPTYRFTWNGYDVDRYYSERLKGIKRLDRNPAVLAQLLVWATVLTQPQDLFRSTYPFLAFSALRTFDVEFGIEDGLWMKAEEEEEGRILSDSDNQLALF
ncbi:MAG: DUF4365 domain-containing protein [Anaerolineales bacterium]|nr:DUF4365 domain-containing protein [Anaerolineales bacterium]